MALTFVCSYRITPDMQRRTRFAGDIEVESIDAVSAVKDAQLKLQRDKFPDYFLNCINVYRVEVKRDDQQSDDARIPDVDGSSAVY